MSTIAVLLNRQLFKLPQTIGILIFSLGISLILFVLNLFLQEDFMTLPKQIITNADMPFLFLNGALPLLLFAGAMQVNLKHLLSRVVSITALTVPGTLFPLLR
jgi:CPA1 family monovalent cation:H+ antiporter